MAFCVELWCAFVLELLSLSLVCVFVSPKKKKKHVAYFDLWSMGLEQRVWDKWFWFFIMVVVIYATAFLGIKLGPQNANYLPMLKIVCVIWAILACELLASILVDPLRLFLINLCGILVEVLCRWYTQIYAFLCHQTILVLNTSWNLFQKICKAFNNFSLKGMTKNQDQDDGGSLLANII